MNLKQCTSAGSLNRHKLPKNKCFKHAREPRIQSDTPLRQPLPLQVFEDLEDTSWLLWMRWVLGGKLSCLRGRFSIAALLVTILADGPQVLEVSMRRHPIIENQADDIIIDALLAPKVSA